MGVLAGLIVWPILLRGPNILDSDPTLVLGQLLIGMGVIAIAGLIYSTPPAAIRLSRNTSNAIIILGTILVQCVALVSLWPALSSDVARYRLDGLTWLTGNSPYATTPRQVLAGTSADAIDRTLPANDFYSIYPPVAQTVFITARAIERVAFGPAKFEVKPAITTTSARWRPALMYVSWAHRGVVLRSIAALAAIGSVLVMLKLLDHAGRTPWLAVLFAWNPLVLLETAGSGHIDMVGVLCVLVMLRMLQKNRFALATLALCLACGVKPMAILLAPLLIRQISERRDWTAARRSIGVAVLTLAIVYLPILLVQSGYRGWFVQLNRYAHGPDINSGLGALFGSWVGGDWLQSYSRNVYLMITPLASAVVLIVSLKKRFPAADAGYWLMLAPLLVGPTAYPYTIVWPLCFVPLLGRSRGWTALTWSATAALAYAAWHQSAWSVPGRILLAEYVPVIMALVIELRDAAAPDSTLYTAPPLIRSQRIG